ncbi:uncharacterized protein PADG_08679 [Paracoccidioides brasiliensis Pb18]|uniref:Uncharacterized protein n=1 Tax=Paracoccidioides brasiliensis (strain Pb18) TaxID=502780 RepID=C1GN35_PARBD|nr:uncharacterized protein PADG_08679 [Paracoccidioides brasiliensis Pb18]EEH46237.2 hypothetical protein PADG_08679 [Paracoccidioides brasiliensis Pb18]
MSSLVEIYRAVLFFIDKVSKVHQPTSYSPLPNESSRSINDCGHPLLVGPPVPNNNGSYPSFRAKGKHRRM